MEENIDSGDCSGGADPATIVSVCHELGTLLTLAVNPHGHAAARTGSFMVED